MWPLPGPPGLPRWPVPKARFAFPDLPANADFSPVQAPSGLTRRGSRADLDTMYVAAKLVARKLKRNRRGGRFLNYALATVNVVATTVLLLASAGVKLPSF